MVGNVLCSVVYAVVLWRFFRYRIEGECFLSCFSCCVVLLVIPWEAKNYCSSFFLFFSFFSVPFSDNWQGAMGFLSSPLHNVRKKILIRIHVV